jgi:hypothetical protein
VKTVTNESLSGFCGGRIGVLEVVYNDTSCISNLELFFYQKLWTMLCREGTGWLKKYYTESKTVTDVKNLFSGV